MTVLVIGGDGKIGAHLVAVLAAAGELVVTTSRRAGAGAAGRIVLDLAETPKAFRLPPGVNTAVLCAAATSQKFCVDHPEESRRANVEGVAKLGRVLARAGVFTVFLSTNLVFDGSIPFVAADAPYAPIGAYGAQKAEAERALQDIFAAGDLGIVRLTKVLDAETPLLLGWRQSLLNGQPVHPFDDVLISPISLGHAVEVLRRVIKERRAGIFHVGGRDEISYADLARSMAAHWGAPVNLVQPHHGREIDSVMRIAPPHASLDTARTDHLLGVEAPSATDLAAELAATLMSGIGPRGGTQ